MHQHCSINLPNAEQSSKSLGSKSIKMFNTSSLLAEQNILNTRMVLSQQKDPIKYLFIEGPGKLMPMIKEKPL